ncbi:unnamed protein product [Penicillium salamii]|uniref:Protein kinase domain-containing protein n=1 Tax=Penicillium salamii TaxID=1612424 RepID=A0A9W4NTT4_9EURO|nr:unnamed protein product [Penicillium salamii]CAG8302139.1 unnamed protein product [Penicillium salamii]CAG8354422.1 unnamed protein product [Penicillium salamii]CAG8360129.1 unnamed protein product [Penicillium salamii]CAG8367482.1 unnamed protein product [Penicillium salamii]
MEPARTQLARATPALSQHGGTTNPSIHSDRLSVAYMSLWSTFQRDAFRVLQEAGISHEVPLNDETELYTVGNELGLTGRFVRNVCDPVIKALELVPGMASTRFADFQAISTAQMTVPDVCLGLVATGLDPHNVYVVGEMKTPWTIAGTDLNINRHESSFRLEPLIGQLVAQMRTCEARFGFLSTYSSTVFVKREADSSFLLSSPIWCGTTQPSLRELLAGFCLMAVSEPKYIESQTFQARNLRGPPPLRVSGRQHDTSAYHSESIANQEETITSNSVVFNAGGATPAVVNCVRLLSEPTAQNKATWLATMGGSTVILKCWGPQYNDLFEAEAEVYNRIWDQQPTGRRNFAKWISRGEIVCSTLFPSGHVLVLEQRPGMRLDRIWDDLSDGERAYVQSDCLNGIHALRHVGLRLDDPGKHNVLFDRDRRVLTLLDFESAQLLESHTYISTYFEMRIMFRSDLMIGRPSGG